MKTIICLLLLAFVAVNAQQTLCEKYVNLTGYTARFIIENVVNDTVGVAVGANSPIKSYFDGSIGGKTNFLAGGAPLNMLYTHLYEFFYLALGCSDGTIGNYSGVNISIAHAGYDIDYFAHHLFIVVVADTMISYDVTVDDATAVAIALDSLKAGVCVDANNDCFTLCNKYTVPIFGNASNVISSVVGDVVAAALADSTLGPFFTGVRGGRPDYTATANAALLGALFDHLVEFFATNLGCTDGTVPVYTGTAATLKIAHVGMNITRAEFDLFNSAVLSVLASYNVEAADLTVVSGVLNSTADAIVDNGSALNAGSSTSSSTGGAGTSSSSTGAAGTSSSTAAGTVSSSSRSGTAGTVSTTTTTTTTTTATSATPVDTNTGFGMVLIAPLLSLLLANLF